MTGHDRAPAEHLTELPMEELKEDLNTLETFVEKLRRKAKKTSSSRKELLSPRSAKSSKR